MQDKAKMSNVFSKKTKNLKERLADLREICKIPYRFKSIIFISDKINIAEKDRRMKFNIYFRDATRPSY